MLATVKKIKPEYPAWIKPRLIQGKMIEPKELIEIKKPKARFLTFDGYISKV